MGILHRYPKKGGGGDATYILTDTLGNVIGGGTIPAGVASPIPAPDASYTVQYDSGTLIEAGTIQSGGSKIVNVDTPEGWSPDADWGWDAAAAQVDDGDDAFVSIYACFPNFTNHAAFTATFSGTATVDWGDGSAPEAVTSGVNISHEFVYAGITQAVTSEGWKPCVIKFESTGDFTLLGIDRVYSPTIYGTYAPQKYVAMKIRSQLATEFQLYNSDLATVQMMLYDFGLVMKVRFANTFLSHARLMKLIYNFSNNTTSNNVGSFGGCPVDIDWNTFDFSNYTNLRSFWGGYVGTGTYSLDIAVDNCTDMYVAFAYNCGFTSIKLRNTGNVQIIPGIYDNPNVIHFEMDDCSALTYTGEFVRTNNNRNLQSLLLNDLRIGIDLTNQRLSEAALNDFMDSIGTANGSQTLTFTGNPGAATCDTTIATGKGFTVTT